MPRLGAGVGGVIFISGSRLPGAGARALLGLFNKHFYEIVRGLAGHDTLVNGPCVMLNDAPHILTIRLLFLLSCLVSC